MDLIDKMKTKTKTTGTHTSTSAMVFDGLST